MNQVPRTGVPLYWMHEQSGVMAQAVHAYFDYVCEPDLYPEPSENQINLLIDYCASWVDCEVFRGVGGLQASIKKVTNVHELKEWIREALQYGIDPF